MSYSKLKLTTDIVKDFEMHPEHNESSDELLNVVPNDLSWAGYADDKLIFIGGFLQDGIDWLFWGAYSKFFKPVHGRFVRKQFDVLLDLVPCGEVSHLVKVGDRTGEMLARFMGAKRSGIVENYCDGEDFNLYVRAK